MEFEKSSVFDRMPELVEHSKTVEQMMTLQLTLKWRMQRIYRNIKQLVRLFSLPCKYYVSFLRKNSRKIRKLYIEWEEDFIALHDEYERLSTQIFRFIQYIKKIGEHNRNVNRQPTTPNSQPPTDNAHQALPFLSTLGRERI